MSHTHHERGVAQSRPEGVRTATRRVDDALTISAGRIPASPHAALALQRTVGNAEVTRLLNGERQPQQGDGLAVRRVREADGRPVVVQREIGTTLRAVEDRFQQIQAENPQWAQAQQESFQKLHRVMSEFDAWMRDGNIGYRFGGSISAFLQGAGRLPQDIDVEVSNGANMTVLLDRMRNPNSGWVGDHVRQDGDVIVIVARNANVPGYSFDIVSEARGFNSPFVLHESMQVEGSAVESGGMMPREELILNYLDRILNKPEVSESKGDANQVADLLKAAGCKSVSDVGQYWNRVLEPIIKPGDDRKPVLKGFLEKIVAGQPIKAPEPMDVD